MPPRVAKRPEQTEGVQEVRPRGTVTYGYGVTKNMGDYNSARIDCSVTLPINPTDAELKEAKETIQLAKELCEAEIEQSVAEILT